MKAFILDFQRQSYPYFEEINQGILKQIILSPEGTSVLDVGAGRCALGEVLCQKGYEVWAIESNEVVAQEASQKIKHVICADLHDMEKIKFSLGEQRFQYIIFSDVLEHVYDPVHVLRSYLPYLAQNGKILVSLPNVVNWYSRLRFALGIFNYEMTGVMDRTHIRFFTLKSARKMLEAAKCIVEKQDYTPFIVRALLPVIKKILGNDQEGSNVKNIMESPFYQWYKKYCYPLEYWMTRLVPSLLAFQIILVAHSDPV